MLILTRRPGKSILIGDNIELAIVSVERNQIRIGIEAPREVNVVRNELIK